MSSSVSWHCIFDLCSSNLPACLWILVFIQLAFYFRDPSYHIVRNLACCEKHLVFENTLNFSLTFWTWLRQILISLVNDMRCLQSWERGSCFAVVTTDVSQVRGVTELWPSGACSFFPSKKGKPTGSSVEGAASGSRILESSSCLSKRVPDFNLLNQEHGKSNGKHMVRCSRFW